MAIAARSANRTHQPVTSNPCDNTFSPISKAPMSKIAATQRSDVASSRARDCCQIRNMRLPPLPSSLTTRLYRGSSIRVSEITLSIARKRQSTGGTRALRQDFHLRQIGRRHAIAARHQRERFDIRKAVEVGSNAGEQRLNLLAHAVFGQRVRLLTGFLGRLLATLPVDGRDVEVALEMEKHQPLQEAALLHCIEPGVLLLPHPLHQDRIAAQERRESASAGVGRKTRLSGGVAHQKDGAALLEETPDALVVMDAAVDLAQSESFRIFSLFLERIETIEAQRLKEARHASRSHDRLAQRHGLIGRRGLIVIEATQPTRAVDIGIDRPGQFAHEARGILPGVSGVEGGGVQDQDRRFGVAPPVLLLSGRTLCPDPLAPSEISSNS